MLNLKDYINKPLWDCHIHNIVGDRDVTNHDSIARKNIRMVNWLPWDKDFSIYKEIKDTEPKSGDILLLNAVDADEMKKAIKDTSYLGVGEINVKKTYKDPESGELLGLWDVSILDETNLDRRPIFLHWDMETPEDYNRLEIHVQSFPEKKHVLCHMGGNYYLQNREVLDKVPQLMKNNPNLWTDISWSTLTWMQENPSILNQLDKNRVLVGSDLCRDSKEIREKRISQLLWIERQIPIDMNVKNLFNI